MKSFLMRKKKTKKAVMPVAPNPTTDNHHSSSQRPQQNNTGVTERKELAKSQQVSESNGSTKPINDVGNHYGVPLQPVDTHTQPVTLSLTTKEQELALANEGIVLQREGFFGQVFFGQMQGQPVAVKLPKEKSDSVQKEMLLMKYDTNEVVPLTLTMIEIQAMVLQFVDGQSLESRLRKPMTWHERLKICGQIASAMRHVHQQDIVHRDLRCANVLLDKQGTAYVSDFGISMLKQHPEQINQEYKSVHYFGGKPIYGNADKHDDSSTTYGKPFDVLFFGILMWRLLTSDTPKELNPDELPNWCLPAYRELIVRCTSVDPERRPSFTQLLVSINLMLIDLDSYMGVLAGCRYPPKPIPYDTLQLSVEVVTKLERELQKYFDGGPDLWLASIEKDTGFTRVSRQELVEGPKNDMENHCLQKPEYTLFCNRLKDMETFKECRKILQDGHNWLIPQFLKKWVQTIGNLNLPGEIEQELLEFLMSQVPLHHSTEFMMAILSLQYRSGLEQFGGGHQFIGQVLRRIQPVSGSIDINHAAFISLSQTFMNITINTTLMDSLQLCFKTDADGRVSVDKAEFLKTTELSLPQWKDDIHVPIVVFNSLKILGICSPVLMKLSVEIAKSRVDMLNSTLDSGPTDSLQYWIEAQKFLLSSMLSYWVIQDLEEMARYQQDIETVVSHAERTKERSLFESALAKVKLNLAKIGTQTNNNNNNNNNNKDDDDKESQRYGAIDKTEHTNK